MLLRYFFCFTLLLQYGCHSSSPVKLPADSLVRPFVAADANVKKERNNTIIYLGGCGIELTSTRPSKNDSSICLCVAAAFTQLENDQIDGLFISKGKVIHPQVNHGLGGGLVISEDGDHVQIIKTMDGKFITKSFIDSICRAGCSFLQQIQLVRDSVKLDFHRDQHLFQRRAIVIFKTGVIAMVETNSAVTLDQFAEQLVELGARDALYTDMGGWDEGWYRDRENKAITVIGTARTSTARQSNWLIFRQ